MRSPPSSPTPRPRPAPQPGGGLGIARNIGWLTTALCAAGGVASVILLPGYGLGAGLFAAAVIAGVSAFGFGYVQGQHRALLATQDALAAALHDARRAAAAGSATSEARVA